MEPLNLCGILIDEMKRMAFKSSAVQSIESNSAFQTALKEPDTVQRTMLTMLINRVFTLGPYVVPAEIRLSLTMSTDCLGWSEDLKLVVLPFLKANEEHFFS